MSTLGGSSDAARGSTVRVGFIGSGFSAALHAEALRRTTGPRVEFVAVAGIRRDRAERFASEHSVPTVYADYRELLADPGIDVVCVCVPNASHAPIAIEAARAGKSVICEKPLTGAFGSSDLTGSARARAERDRALASAAEIAAAVEQAGVHFLYAENWVYAPAMAKTKRLLAASRGRILDLRAEESHSGSHAPRSRRRDTAGGGALLMLGSHAIGAALHLKRFEAAEFGSSPVSVVSVTADTARLHESAASRAGGHDWLVSDWHDVETWANVVLAFSDGTRAVITASFAMLGGVRNTFEVYTTNGAYHANMTPSNALLAYTPDSAAFGDEYLHEKIESRTGWISASPDEDWLRGYPQEMQDFVECVATGRRPLADLELATDVIDVIYAAYSSAEEGRRIHLEPRSIPDPEGPSP
ncbi:Gfo/Idh/MocA family protein [Planctomonas psychrotolerans]|uniref:Gfo/Idh/MocA family protein n=1 Tax=Planctomonas psychrotolerans TaxID=2528712 RepID=UPI001D0D0751|nr:Gfo/Idh/MocA family oxidoreductase [Planctomonas psychrotolerans]